MALLKFTKEKPINKVVEIDINMIVTAPDKRNIEYQAAEISELTESVMKSGIFQPLSVKRCEEGFEIITGEKYLRVAEVCGMKSVPCIVYETNDRDAAIVALVETIKIQNLSFFEEAAAIERLITYYGMTQEDAASKLGKAQSTVANKLRLLRLTDKERELIVKYNLTERHARSLLRLASDSDRMIVLEKIIKENLNVEHTENLIDDFIGSQRERANYKKRSKVFHNIGIFINAINKAVEAMQMVGIPANSQRIQNDEYIEYRIKIPVQK